MRPYICIVRPKTVRLLITPTFGSPVYRAKFDAAGVHPDDCRSLSDLQKFPFSKIKIDQSFVRAMVDDPDCAASARWTAPRCAGSG